MRKGIDRIPFEEWHPPISNGLWERIAPPGRRYAGKWRDEESFNQRDIYSAQGTFEVSCKEVLEHILDQNRVAFAIEHYVTEIGLEHPRILEVGSWPMRNEIVAAEFGTTLIALLSQNQDYIVAGIDKDEAGTEGLDISNHATTMPYLGTAEFFIGDIHDKKIRRIISGYLGGLPEIIVGNMVFEKRMGAWWAEELNRRRAIRIGGKIGASLSTNIPTDEYAYVSENLAATCNSYLAEKGILVVSNRNYGEIPDFVKQMPLLRVYLDEQKKDLVQIRAKVDNSYH